MEEFIYFLRPVGLIGPVKIGSSWEPISRMRSLMALSPFPLEVITTAKGNRDMERKVHNCFADAHSHCEWFHPVPRLLAAIEKIKAGAEIDEAIDLTDIRGNVLGQTQRMTREANLLARSQWPSASSKPVKEAAE